MGLITNIFPHFAVLGTKVVKKIGSFAIFRYFRRGLYRICIIMIDYVKGELAELTPAQAVVECGGVGYAVNISLNTYSAIQGKRECKLDV